MSAFTLLCAAALLAASVTSKDKCMKENPVECAALMNVGTALGVSKWTPNKRTNWMNKGVSVCEWAGVICSSSSSASASATKPKGTVVELDLSHAGVDGYIHSDIGKLTELTEFDISGHRPSVYEATCGEQNLRRSVIPDSFWTLTKLKKIDFEYTCIAGPVPEDIGNLTALTSIEFHGNYLNGTFVRRFTYKK